MEICNLCLTHTKVVRLRYAACPSQAHWAGFSNGKCHLKLLHNCQFNNLQYNTLIKKPECMTQMGRGRYLAEFHLLPYYVMYIGHRLNHHLNYAYHTSIRKAFTGTTRGLCFHKTSFPSLRLDKLESPHIFPTSPSAHHYIKAN